MYSISISVIVNLYLCCKIVAFSYLHGLALCFFMCLFNWLENVQEYVAAQMKGQCV